MKRHSLISLFVVAILSLFSLSTVYAASVCGPQGCFVQSSANKPILIAQERQGTGIVAPPGRRSNQVKNNQKMRQKAESDMIPVKCYKVIPKESGAIDIRFPDVIPGDFQRFARKVEACRQAWLQDYEQNYKANYRVGLVLGFRKDDPAEYRKNPLVRLIPR